MKHKSMSVCAAILVTLCVEARAQQPAGITVVGKGTVESKPNTIEIVGTVSGEAELAGDALVKYRDNKRRAIEAIDALKIEGLAVEGEGFSINTSALANQMQIMMGNAQAPSANPKVTISEPLTITMKGIDTLAEEELVKRIISVIDAGKDAGLNVGAGAPMNIYEMQIRGNQPPALAKFMLVGGEDAKSKAYAAAIKDAQSSAQRLADLAGVKLGKVQSVHEGPATSDRQTIVYAYDFGGDKEDGAYSSTSFSNIPVTVTLSVRFGIE